MTTHRGKRGDTGRITLAFYPPACPFLAPRWRAPYHDRVSHFRAYHPDDAAALLALWDDATGGAHPISPALWEAITVRDPGFAPADLILALGAAGAPIGFVLTKGQPAPYPGLERYAGDGWIALLAVAPHVWRQGIGRALLAGAQARLMARGATRIVLGANFHHALPGIPRNFTDARDFFHSQGYVEGSEQWDVRRDLRAEPGLPAPVAPPGVVLRPYEPGEREALVAFLQATFPGRWPRDVEYGLDEGWPIGQVMGAFRDGVPVGFAQLHPPGSPGASRWSGFEPTVAALGPIGVGNTERGQGLGLALLLAGLQALSVRGAGPTVIDWTDLLDFYARAGFSPWLGYVQAHRSFP